MKMRDCPAKCGTVDTYERGVQFDEQLAQWVSRQVWAAVFTFNPYLLISINELMISIIHLLISINELLISIK